MLLAGDGFGKALGKHMKKLHRWILAGVLCTLVFFYTACERTAEPDMDRVGWEYYPLKLGQYRTYDVYRINYNFAVENDTLAYELKELVADYYLDQEQDTVFVLHRLQRSAAGAQWQLDSAYLVQRTPKWLNQTINNRPQLQLVFPVAEGRTWNSNMLNAAPADSFHMEAVGKPFETTHQLYDNTLKVVQENIVNTIVVTDQREEVYAYGVGLVYKFTNYLAYCNTPNCSGEETNPNPTGLYLKMNLKDSGIDPL